MVGRASPVREFKPGTTGWTARDLDDPEIEKLWEAGRYEIIDGILVELPPPIFEHGVPTPDLLMQVRDYMRARGDRAVAAVEVDLITQDERVFRVDGAVMSEADLARQREARGLRTRQEAKLGRLLVPPTLVVESISEGHAGHDRRLKRQKYAEFCIPNFWIVDYTERSLECYRHEASAFVLDARGTASEVVRPPAFPGLEIRLKDLFE